MTKRSFDRQNGPGLGPFCRSGLTSSRGQTRSPKGIIQTSEERAKIQDNGMKAAF